MQKYKYALDLEENIYSLNKDSRYIDRKIVYNHTC